MFHSNKNILKENIEKNYIILLPSSESKLNGGNENKPYRLIKNKEEFNYFLKPLWIEREKIFGILRETISKQKIEELEKIFKLKTKKLIKTIQLNEDLLNQPTMPAIKRFNGTMFKEINYYNLSNKEKNNFNKSIIFIDGLFGLLKPTDYIPSYKLRINSKLLNLNISKFWENNIHKGLFEIAKNKIIIDILPKTHRDVIPNQFKKDKNYIFINFKIKKEKKFINLSHNSKIIKVELIKYILKNNKLSIKRLKKFKHSLGFNFNQKNSSENYIEFSN